MMINARQQGNTIRLGFGSQRDIFVGPDAEDVFENPIVNGDVYYIVQNVNGDIYYVPLHFGEITIDEEYLIEVLTRYYLEEGIPIQSYFKYRLSTRRLPTPPTPRPPTIGFPPRPISREPRFLGPPPRDEDPKNVVEEPKVEKEEDGPEPTNPSPDEDPQPKTGMGALPQLDTLQKIAKQSYSNTPSSFVGPFKLISSTPTLKFYGLRGPEGFYDTIVVGIRGTNPTDKQDIWADTQLAIGKLESTPRFQNDLRILEEFKKRQEFSENIDYYGVGHSLGGAILDAFLKKGLLQKGVSYNPAISLGDDKKEINNRRIYQEGDPLLSIMGRNAKNVEVRPKKKKSIINSIVSHIPYIGFVKDKLDAHGLDNFIGGEGRRH